MEKWLDYWWKGQKLWKIQIKMCNNLPLFTQYPGGLGGSWGMKKIKEIDWKIHHFVDNLANFYIEISNFRPKKHSELSNTSLYKVCVSHNLDFCTWWSNLLIWHFPSKIFLHPKVHDQSIVLLYGISKFLGQNNFF